MFAPDNYVTTVMLFKLLCAAGLEVIALFYLDWLIKHDGNNEFIEKVTPNYTPPKTAWTKGTIVLKYMIRQSSRKIKMFLHIHATLKGTP